MGTISRLLKLILEHTGLLDELRVEDLNDVYRLNAAVHLLQLQAQALIDIIMRAAALLGLGVKGYIDAGVRLRDAGVLSPRISLGIGPWLGLGT
ncbi:hypothetical protein [Caldivirga maquilingensis]|uniref:PaREP11 n=1 Tax=Caldivirga maquilingensis (strain ATCC 700844 / DSM 13496 / JCM 10307 / IC-167) TaxID=397948 RepID=A8M9V1_CALMQ|nr:hypothetical protein [Caldivirga maquilingensis]ABW02422.1 paREP11 [Caldivirga maquilingensis IC-167]